MSERPAAATSFIPDASDALPVEGFNATARGSIPPDLDLDVLRQFRIVFRSARRHFQGVEQATGISGSQLWALSCIAAEPQLRVSGLARQMSIHQSTASNLVESLVEAGLVLRSKGRADQRAVCLALTAAGTDCMARAPGPQCGLLPDALRKLPPDALQQLHVSLNQLLGVMASLDIQGANMPLSEM